MTSLWGYHSHNGPEKWPELFPMASGHRQSPVNLSRESTTRGSTLKTPLTWKYVPGNTKSLINPGYCWRVDVNGEGSALSGGPLMSDVYQLEQFHCHWGCSDGKGSEHTVDGVTYSVIARARDYDFDEDFGEIEPASTLSDIRKKNVKLLQDVDSKYQGKVSSRKEMEMDSDENEIESDASSEDEHDIKSFAQKLNKSKSAEIDSDSDDEIDTNDREELETWDDDYEGEEIDEEQSSNEEGSENSNDEENEDDDDDDDEESDFDGGDIIPQAPEDTLGKSNKQDLSRILPKQRTEDQQNKGTGVQSQLKIWEKLLEVRIHSQKMLIKSNSLPQPSKFEQLREGDEFAALANETEDNITNLVSQMHELQSLLLNQYSETKELGAKRKSIALDGSSEAKRSRLAEQLEVDYSNFKPYQYSVISKWHDRTKVLTPGSIKTQKQQGNIDVLRKIEGVLANREELIKKSQLLKGGYELFDKSTGTIEKKKISAGDENEIEDNNDDDENVYCTEVYDDSDFYHTQLRELIEYKTSSSSNANEMAKQFSDLQKLRKKMKKTVDTRASKGRKIRYVVHNKLVSFMAPNNPGQWDDEQCGELFKSFFGAQS